MNLTQQVRCSKLLPSGEECGRMFAIDIDKEIAWYCSCKRVYVHDSGLTPVVAMESVEILNTLPGSFIPRCILDLF